MPTTIEVNKQSVEALLGSGKTKPFVIPEYQRELEKFQNIKKSMLEKMFL
ncbi:hypothetical protein LLE98_12255 [Holdemanella porci]|nr:hypothetical protein [Holdemanella porci]MCC3362104.1 hypothetical protein [Holdemanella porci]